MTQHDFWQHRFETVTAGSLSPEAAAMVLDLVTEDRERFKEALRAFIHASDIVVCECSDRECLAGHTPEHAARAYWRMTHIEDGEDDYVHLCTPCKASHEQKPGADRFRFEEMEDDGEEVAGDA